MDYQPEDLETEPDLEVLSRALDIAADPTPRRGMGRAVIFITPPQFTDLTVGLESLIARANQQNTHIFVWVIGSQDYFDLPGATQLQALSDQNRGDYFAFSGTEDVPNIEAYLAPLRYIYRLKYESQAYTSGNHQLAVEVSTEDLFITTPPRSFEVELQPPIPIFVSPPSLITRTYLDEEQESEESNDEALIPTEQDLEVQIEFPDGYERPLRRTTLYVDGTLADENTTQPFEQFTWDISDYTESGAHTVLVEVVDSLGLSGLSIEKSIQINIPESSQGFFATLPSQRLWIAGLIVLLSGSVLALILILGGRIRTRDLGRAGTTARGAAGEGGKRRRSFWRFGDRTARSIDPVTQPVEFNAEGAVNAQQRLPGWVTRLNWPQRGTAPTAIAYLAPVTGTDQVTLPAPYPLAPDEIIFGRDPLQATLVLEDPSVESVHAYIRRENETFRLTDAGSIAGTWVNYTPVPQEGTLLQHGDGINIGRVHFRYMLREQSHRPKPVITLQEPDQ
jgi:hypothetical protein